jgi:hypothetical protein
MTLRGMKVLQEPARVRQVLGGACDCGLFPKNRLSAAESLDRFAQVEVLAGAARN